ncbi:MAG TPA: IS1380 family transposase, partial [Streptosporangiaceae bacterium]
ASSDGGAVLLKALDDRLGVTRRLTASLADRRQPGKVQHELIELVRQRIFGIACGYADCNDAARLAEDPIHKLLLERDPLAGPALASQSTLSRFENAVGRSELYLASLALAELVIEHHRARLKGRARRITIDLDPTDDPTHGQQEFTFFNGHYDTWCYLPLVATLTFNAEPMQYLVAAVLRPGNSPAKRGAVGLLTRLCRRLRAAFPGATLRVRLDGGFASPEILDCLDAEGVEYVVAMASNVRLVKRSRRLMGRARVLSKASGATEHLYGETRYAARKWKHKRRVIIKAEVVRHPGRAPKNNPRFVVTNLTDAPETVYQVYCGRGDMENRLKELQHGLAMDRTSCPRFTANQFRVLLTAAAYILFQTLQTHAQGTACADAQVSTLRERLLKLAAWVQRSARRIVTASAHQLSLARHLAADRPRRQRGPRLIPASWAGWARPRDISPSATLWRSPHE